MWFVESEDDEGGEEDMYRRVEGARDGHREVNDRDARRLKPIQSGRSMVMM